VEEQIEARLTDLERHLGKRSAKDRNALATGKKLMWLSERKIAPCESFP